MQIASFIPRLVVCLLSRCFPLPTFTVGGSFAKSPNGTLLGRTQLDCGTALAVPVPLGRGGTKVNQFCIAPSRLPALQGRSLSASRLSPLLAGFLFWCFGEEFGETLCCWRRAGHVVGLKWHFLCFWRDPREQANTSLTELAEGWVGKPLGEASSKRGQFCAGMCKLQQCVSKTNCCYVELPR